MYLIKILTFSSSFFVLFHVVWTHFSLFLLSLFPNLSYNSSSSNLFLSCFVMLLHTFNFLLQQASAQTFHIFGFRLYSSQRNDSSWSIYSAFSQGIQSVRLLDCVWACFMCSSRPTRWGGLRNQRSGALSAGRDWKNSSTTGQVTFQILSQNMSVWSK